METESREAPSFKSGQECTSLEAYKAWKLVPSCPVPVVELKETVDDRLAAPAHSAELLDPVKGSEVTSNKCHAAYHIVLCNCYLQ